MKEIQLTQGKIAIVDDEDFERVSKHKWYAASDWHTGKWYAMSTIDGATVGLHRFILNINDSDIHLDHKNRDGLDNRKENLRIATPQQNSANSAKGSSSEFTSRYKGVSQNAAGNWRARIKVNGDDMYLGSFKTQEEAAKIYDKYALEYFGEFANPNFPKEVLQ